MTTVLVAACLLTETIASPRPVQGAAHEEEQPVLATAIRESDSPHVRNPHGRTPLMHAVTAGDANAVSRLLRDGASPDVGDRLGRTPLHLAMSATIEISGLLIRAGADLDQRNAGGVTPLMLAAGNGRRDMVDMILEAGARLDLKDYQGNSVTDWARRSGNGELFRMLEKRLAQSSHDQQPMNGSDFAEEVFVDVKFPDWFKPGFLDLNEDLKEALDAGKQGIMIFISTRRCSYCKAFIQTSLNLPEIRRRVQENFDVIGLEIFDDSEMTDPNGRSLRVKEFVTANKAAFTPTLIFYGAGGQKILKIVGYYPPDKFRTVLDYLEGGHYLSGSLRSYFVETAASTFKPDTRINLNDGLFSSPPYILDRQAGRAEQPLLVLFEQADCGSCDRFHERVLSDKTIRRLMSGFETVRLDAFDADSRLITPGGLRVSPAQWYEQLDLSYSPALVFFDEAGEEFLRLDSETQRYRMEGSLQLVLEKGYIKDAQLQRWRRDKAIELFNSDKGR